ncbi:hypothetical protein ACA910_010688 [Epithemia clementina (nom. ined.)]
MDLCRSTHPSERNQDIVDFFALHNLHDISHFFRLPRGQLRWTWRMRREVNGIQQILHSTTDGILSDNPPNFAKFSLHLPRHFVTDHRLVGAELWLSPILSHRTYLRHRRHCPPIPYMSTLADHMINSLCTHLPPRTLPKLLQRDHSWISSSTWRCVDCFANLRRRFLANHSSIHFLTNGAKHQCMDVDEILCCLHSEVRTGLRRDRRPCAEKVSVAIEQLQAQSTAASTVEAFCLLRPWYCSFNKQNQPTQHDLDDVRHEYTTLFSARESCGVPLPTHVAPFPIDDTILDEPAIASALLQR